MLRASRDKFTILICITERNLSWIRRKRLNDSSEFYSPCSKILQMDPNVAVYFARRFDNPRECTGWRVMNSSGCLLTLPIAPLIQSMPLLCVR
jgi:hypothetical protein